MKRTVLVFILLLASLGVTSAQQTTPTPMGPTYPTVPGSSFTYNPILPGGASYSPYSPLSPGSFGAPTSGSPFTTTTGMPGFGTPGVATPGISTTGTTFSTPTPSLFSPFLVTAPGATTGTGQGSQVVGAGGDASMFNTMFGLNPAALNPFSLFGTPTTLNPFSMFFGNTATAPSPVVQTPSTVTTPSSTQLTPATPAPTTGR